MKERTTKTTGIRLANVELEAVKKEAEKLGITQAEFMKQAIRWACFMTSIFGTRDDGAPTYRL